MLAGPGLLSSQSAHTGLLFFCRPQDWRCFSEQGFFFKRISSARFVHQVIVRQSSTSFARKKNGNQNTALSQWCFLFTREEREHYTADRGEFTERAQCIK